MALQQSKAVWKIIANPQPLAHVRKAPKPRHDQWANGDHGAPLGREHEVADILAFIKQQNIRNTVWLAADVHYSAAYHFDPNRAAFRNFDPFWEFISGPFHTRPGRVKNFDKTFGAEQHFRTPRPPIVNPPPSDGFLYFGHAKIDAKTGDLRVTIRDLNDRTLFSRTLNPIT
jgi:alkaline phosphatase D